MGSVPGAALEGHPEPPGHAAVRFDQDVDRQTAVGIRNLLNRPHDRRGALRGQQPRRRSPSTLSPRPHASSGRDGYLPTMSG